MNRNLILIGFMGAGKTTVGHAFAKKNRVLFVDTDQMIEESAGMSIAEIFEYRGEAAFRQEETEALKTLLKRPAGTVISVGGGLPMREENRELLKKLGLVVYLRVEVDTVLLRLEGDQSRPLLSGGDAKARVESLLAQRSPVYQEASHLVIDVDLKDVDGVVLELEERMESVS